MARDWDKTHEADLSVELKKIKSRLTNVTKERDALKRQVDVLTKAMRAILESGDCSHIVAQIVNLAEAETCHIKEISEKK